jgi:hypothetical protein
VERARARQPFRYLPLQLQATPRLMAQRWSWKNAGSETRSSRRPCGVIDLLAAYHIVPPLYSCVGDEVLVNELRRVFELGALGQRCSDSKQAILAGHPGIGKTTMLLYIAAVAAVCVPHVLTVYWTWERAAVPSTAGGCRSRVGLNAGIAGAAVGMSASDALPVPHVTEPVAAEPQRPCAPPATVAQVRRAADAPRHGHVSSCCAFQPNRSTTGCYTD